MQRIGVGLKDYDSPKITITPEEFYFIGQWLHHEMSAQIEAVL